MPSPDELADALFAERADAMDWRAYAYVTKTELRTLAQASAKIGWDEGERHESEYLNMWGQFCPNPVNPYAKEDPSE